MENLNIVSKLLARPFVWLVVLYQKTLSPDHGPLKKHYPYGYCKFYPTCSMYAKETLEYQGVAGLPKIFSRILRCNPFTSPKIDHP
jgi:putative membrane protein insertion efficiency factor